MLQEGYNDNYFCIGTDVKNFFEGYGLKKDGLDYVYYYTERGQDRVIERFKSELEAVKYTLRKIKTNDSAKEHCIGFLKSELLFNELLEKLKSRNIRHRFDSIPYGGVNDLRHRVFVYGKDIDLVRDLKKIYFKE